MKHLAWLMSLEHFTEAFTACRRLTRARLQAEAGGPNHFFPNERLLKVILAQK